MQNYMEQREEVVFSNLAKIAENREIISDKCKKDKWRSIPYRTGKYEGHMLVAAESIFPSKIELQLNLQGWYHIYLCMINMRSNNYTYVKLSDDLCYTGLEGAKRGNPYNWCTTEYVEEIYWKSADLTDQKIILDKSDSCDLAVAGLVWIRCVPMNEDEVNDYCKEKVKNRCIQVHFDEDSYAKDKFETEEDYLIKLYALKDSNAEFCSMEISFDYDRKENDYTIPLLNFEKRWNEGDYAFAERQEIILKKFIEYAHNNGIGFYASNRMEVGNFDIPYNRPNWSKKFVDENPQYYCKNRDGSVTAICSYAYEEVQEYVIRNLCEMFELGFDGVSLIYHRGMHIGFEEPVIERFKELYPDISPYTLPVSDYRLHSIWCSFMNDFMRKLRSRIKGKINVITDYSLQSAKNFGLDVEYWAKNGLVDIVSQADMETYEDLSGCMKENDLNIIDMEKYSNQLINRPIIRRKWGTDIEKVCRHIPEYQNLSKNYGVEVYHILPWVHSIPYTDYDAIVKRMLETGANKFLSWNTNHLVWDLPQWHVVSHIGNKRDNSIQLSRYHRVLELAGKDISHFNPNWRG